MPALDGIRERITTLTFDCYGTLIDWRKGLNESLAKVFGDLHDAPGEELYYAYLGTEMEVEAEGYRRYREVLTIVAERLARRFRANITRERAAQLVELLADWKPFADSNEALARLKDRFRLGVLSNVDRDLFARTSRHFTTSFDFVVTAEDVGSYKPSEGHFRRLLEQFAEPGAVLHVGQSLYHDGVPAQQLKIPFVWINRYDDPNDVEIDRTASFNDLLSFAVAMGRR